MGEIAAKALIGMPVYSINEGDAIGMVKNIILDTDNKELLAVAVDRRGWYRDVKIIPYNKIKNIGNDAITIEERNNAERVANLPKMVKFMDQPSTLNGCRVISDNGHTLGRIEEYYLNTDSGKICRLEVSGGVKGNILSGKAFVKGEYIITIGGAAVVVDHKCLDNLEEIESPLKVNFQAAKEKTNQAWQTTVSTSKKLGESFAARINELQKNRKVTKGSSEATDQVVEAEAVTEQVADIKESMPNPEPVAPDQPDPIESELETTPEVAEADTDSEPEAIIQQPDIEAEGVPEEPPKAEDDGETK